MWASTLQRLTVQQLSNSLFQSKFQIASKITGEEFLSQLDYYIDAWLPARDIVKQALETRLEIDASGAVVRFDKVRGEVNLDYLVRHLQPELITDEFSRHRGKTISSSSNHPFPQLHHRSYTFSTQNPRTPTRSGGYSVCPSPQTRSRTASPCQNHGAV